MITTKFKYVNIPPQTQGDDAEVKLSLEAR